MSFVETIKSVKGLIEALVALGVLAFAWYVITTYNVSLEDVVETLKGLIK